MAKSQKKGQKRQQTSSPSGCRQPGFYYMWRDTESVINNPSLHIETTAACLWMDVYIEQNDFIDRICFLFDTFDTNLGFVFNQYDHLPKCSYLLPSSMISAVTWLVQVITNKVFF